MIKRAITVSVTFLVFLIIPSFVFAESLSKLNLAPSFFPSSARVTKDGMFLIAGREGYNQESYPVLVLVNTKGEIVERIEEKSKKGSIFRDAIQMKDDSILVVSALSDDATDWTIECYSDGNASTVVDKLQNVTGLMETKDGFITYGVSKTYASYIMSYGDDGTLQWTIDLDDWLKFVKVLTDGNMNIAVCNKYIRDDDREYGPIHVILAFDNNGDILWRHDGDYNENIRDAVLTSDGGLITISDLLPPDDIDLSTVNKDTYMVANIAKYTKEGEAWKTPYIYSLKPGERRYEGKLDSVIQDGNVYIATYEHNDITNTIVFDDEGNIVKIGDEIADIGAGLLKKLFKVGEDVFMYICKYDRTKNDDKNYYISMLGVIN